MSQDREHEHDAHPLPRADRAGSTNTVGRENATAALVAPSGPVPSGILMRKGNGPLAEDAEQAVAKASEAAAAGGQSLPADLLTKFEASLGVELGDVRVHTGPDSADATTAVGALAYATGNDIHFAPGQYDPSSAGGQELIAHEVAHTVQQRGGAQKRQTKLAVSSAGDASEDEADRAASAMMSGAPASLSGTGVTTARKEDPKAGADKNESAKPLSPEDKARLANALQLLDKARANVQAANGALSSYAQASPALLTNIKANFDATHTVYETQFERVNQVIETAKRVYALQVAVFEALVSEVTGHLAGVVLDAFTKVKQLELTESIAEDALTGAMAGATSLDALNTVRSEAATMTGGATSEGEGAISDAGKKGVGLGTEARGPGTSGSDQNAFLQNYAQLQGAANALLPMAMGLARVLGPFASAHTLVTVMQQDGKSRPGKTAQGVETDAANVWNSSSGLAGVPGAAGAALAALQAAGAASAAAKPKGDMEIQKELWVKWAANLPSDNTDALDLDGIEDHLRRIGIWDQLGINVGGWMSDKDEALAVVSAKAQEMVLAHKGATADVLVETNRAEIPGLGSLPILFESQPAAKRVRACVVSARTNGPLDHSLFDTGSRDRDEIAKSLLARGKITVVMRVLETLPD